MEENKLEISIEELVQAESERKKTASAGGFEKFGRLGELLEGANVGTFWEVEQIPAGKELSWNITPEQVAAINNGDRAALDKFYFDTDNYRRIKSCAYLFMRHNYYLKAVISVEDLMQQFYCDLRIGMVKLRPFDKGIRRALFNAYNYAAVGGIDEVYIYREKENDVEEG